RKSGDPERDRHPGQEDAEDEQGDDGEEPVAAQEEAQREHDHAHDRREHEEDDPEAEALRPASREPDDEEGGARAEPRGERRLDRTLEGASHQSAFQAMRPPTPRRMTAMRYLSDRAGSRWVIRAPTRLPGSAPSATAADRGSTTSPRP